MKDSANFLKLVSSRPAPCSGLGDHEATLGRLKQQQREAITARLDGLKGYPDLDVELADLYDVNRPVARSLMSRFQRELRRELREAEDQGQLTLFAPAYRNVVYFIEEHNEPCPECERPTVERSRQGLDKRFYTCATTGCDNNGGKFILLLGTGDD